MAGFSFGLQFLDLSICPYGIERKSTASNKQEPQQGTNKTSLGIRVVLFSASLTRANLLICLRIVTSLLRMLWDFKVKSPSGLLRPAQPYEAGKDNGTRGSYPVCKLSTFSDATLCAVWSHVLLAFWTFRHSSHKFNCQAFLIRKIQGRAKRGRRI